MPANTVGRSGSFRRDRFFVCYVDRDDGVRCRGYATLARAEQWCALFNAGDGTAVAGTAVVVPAGDEARTMRALAKAAP